jgi:hypothetical protein
LLGELGLCTAGRDDARDDDFAKEFFSALQRTEEHATVGALCSELCNFASTWRRVAFGRENRLTKCDLGVGDSAEAATADDYEIALRSFVATLFRAERAPRSEGGATAAVGV